MLFSLPHSKFSTPLTGVSTLPFPSVPFALAPVQASLLFPGVNNCFRTRVLAYGIHHVILVKAIIYILILIHLIYPFSKY